MGEYMIWFWLVIFIIALVVEFLSVEFISVWFALATLPTMIVSYFYPDNLWLQVIVFFVSGFVLMALTRPVLIKYFKRNVVSTNVDSYIGKVAIVIKEISDTQRGQVDFENMNWTAISSETIPVGSKVRILAVEGNKFIVTNIENKED